MRVQCSISNIEFSVEHFPATLFSREVSHPIFSLPQKKLLTFLHKWSGSELTSTDSYLLFLALLNSSDMVQFRVPVFRNPKTDSIVANHMESLAKIVVRMNTVTNPITVFHPVVISQDTRFLENIGDWIDSWQRNYEDFLDGYASAHDNRKLITREAALERLIKNPHKPLASYAGQIAEWAQISGEFPSFLTISPFTKQPIPIAEYWKTLIVKAANPENIFTLPKADLEELLEHCELNVKIGNIFANALFKILRGALARQKDFLGLDTNWVTPNSGGFEILSPEHAQMKILIDAAPESEPIKSTYPKLIDYLRAKTRWDMKMKFTAEVAPHNTVTDSKYGI